MNSFRLTIVTPEGEKFSGDAESVTVRSTQGAVTILANHINFVTSIGMGPASVTINGERRTAACIGGILTMNNNVARVIATTFEWSEDIDLPRAKAALARAEEKLAQNNITPTDKALATAARQRALVRISCANAK